MERTKCTEWQRIDKVYQPNFEFEVDDVHRWYVNEEWLDYNAYVYNSTENWHPLSNNK